MSHRRTIRTTAVAAAAALSAMSALLAAAPATARTDTTPPSTPVFGYAQGFQCLMLIVGVPKVTDDVTPQDRIVYRVLANGVDVGALEDRGTSGMWAVLHLLQPGPSTVRVQAVDLAGNRSTSRGVAVTGYFTPGCTPGHL
ncbi:hypothetical protein Cch01nite_09650 [Cellulomonas chitinilytica]|uniref:Uncharacterized protein n=1 Tax=Cellulomonas chitinilytica TaxID=398759 RepID=A0A919U098_9CELL|nr:hypothetical protein [Cellulomonas chitinilytica]GIG20241.1 hypothetical protein Cch01nite_09650 [Cellulomonas chitinilytica]